MKYFLTIAIAFLNICIPAKAQLPARYDVIIDELLPDPTPAQGLPSSEFLELKNVSAYSYDLYGWKVSDGSSTATLPHFVLPPDSFVIICAQNAASAFSLFGSCLGVTNFPSLNNDADVIYLKSPANNLIHAVAYNSDWYGNELKKEGGWTLEMIDTKNPCQGSGNWKASVDPNGGTPGKPNSISGSNPDQEPPRLINVFANDSATITLLFNESLDSISGASVNNYIISDGIGIPISDSISSLLNSVILRLSKPLDENKIYSVTATVNDCAGNKGECTSRVAKASEPDSFNVVINEILFNPGMGGVDYVEIYNRSQRTFDLKKLYMANRSNSGGLNDIISFSEVSRLFFPGDYIVITEDPEIIKQQYLVKDPNALLKVSNLPSFPDDKGDAIILNSQGNILDEVKYYHQWQFGLISNEDGVALERIDYNSPSEGNNFHSAATSAGYGTPGYKNSQYKPDDMHDGEVIITPEIFSPDNDGFDDFVTVSYKFPSPGYVANITVFDASGRPVRYLQHNALSGINGTYRWDGLGEKQQRLQQGIYIIFTEIFNNQGKKKQFKNVVVLTRK